MAETQIRYSTTLRPYNYKINDAPSTSVPTKEYSYKVINDSTPASAPVKEYTYQIKDIPPTNVLKDYLPISVQPKEYSYKLKENPARTPATTPVPPKGM